MVKTTELAKVPYQEKPDDYSSAKLTTVKIDDESLLPWGGCEGKKYGVLVTVSRGKRDSKPLKFLTKEHRPYDRLDIESCWKTVWAYSVLRKKGLPVPPTTRFYIKEVDKKEIAMVLMTDMREGGKYRLWGYSDKPGKEVDELKEMKIQADNIPDIMRRSAEVAKSASNNGVRLYFYNYHLRQNIETGEFDIVLLDIDDVNIYNNTPSGRLRDLNQQSLSEFIAELKEKLKV